MGQLVAKSAKMANANEGENSNQIYENIESLGEVDTMRDDAVNEKDSILSEVRQTANEVIELMVEGIRVQEEILRAIKRNRERLEQLISITNRIPMEQDYAKNGVNTSEIAPSPKRSDTIMCFKCRRLGHIRRECPLKYLRE